MKDLALKNILQTQPEVHLPDKEARAMVMVGGSLRFSYLTTSRVCYCQRSLGGTRQIEMSLSRSFGPRRGRRTKLVQSFALVGSFVVWPALRPSLTL